MDNFASHLQNTASNQQFTTVISRVKANARIAQQTDTPPAEIVGKWERIVTKRVLPFFLALMVFSALVINWERCVDILAAGDPFMGTMYWLGLSFGLMVIIFYLTFNPLPVSEQKRSSFSFYGVVQWFVKLLFGHNAHSMVIASTGMIVLEFLINVIAKWEHHFGDGYLWFDVLVQVTDLASATLTSITLASGSHFFAEMTKDSIIKHDKTLLAPMLAETQFEAYWEANKNELLYEYILTQAGAGKAYAVKILDAFDAVKAAEANRSESSAVPFRSDVPSVPNIPNTAPAMGFANMTTTQNHQSVKNVGTTGTTGTNGTNGTFGNDDLTLAQQVLDAYPDLDLSTRGWHTRITNVTGLSKGNGTTRVFNAMQHLTNQPTDKDTD